MSIEKAAEFARMHGRGNDSMLVHMSPKEVNALQAMAKQHGGSLTINPQTGLPEAGFLDAILPAVAGAGLSLIPGVGPLMAAGIVGAGTGLLTKDLNKGLMAGLGAFGGASLAGGLMNAGAGAGLSSVEAAAAANPTANIAELTQAAQSNIDPSLLEGMSAEQVAQANVLPQNASNFDKLLKGTSNTTFNADFFKKNLMPLGAIAAPLLMGGGQGNLFGKSQQPQEDSPAYIRPYTFQQTRNPGYTGAGTPYFTQTMTPGTPVAASDWGSRNMADGGITSLPAVNPQPGVVVYDPVSGRYIQQAANTVPMTPNAAPVTEPVGGIAPVQYDPLTRQYVTPPPAVTPMPNATVQEPIDYAYGLGGGETGSVADDGTTSGNESGGADGSDGSDGGADGSGEGWNNGGLMRYAMGGDIGARYQSPDDMSMGDRVGAHAAVNMGPQFPMQGQYQGYAEGGITNTKMAAVQQYSALAASSPDGMKQVMAKAKAGDYNAMTALNNVQGTPNQNYAGGGISHLGGYSDGGRLLKGPGDGVSDDIPAQIGARQPARLADGEFVVPARIVSELGNGSTKAGAKRLYAMMDRVQSGRKKSVGKGKVAVDSKAYKHLPA